MIPSRTLALGLLCVGASIGAGDESPTPIRYTVSEDGSPVRVPQAAVDRRGNVFVAFGRDNRVFMTELDLKSQAFGATFEVGSVETLALGGRRGPRIAVTDSSIVVTAIGGKVGRGQDGDVLAWISKDRGRSWAGPNRINQVVGSAREGLHGMASLPDGRVFCAWLDLREERMEVWGAASRDGGATWSRDRLVYRTPEGPICPCCHPSVAFAPDGTVLVMWRNLVDGDRDLYLIRSRDLGTTFGAAEKLGRDSWLLDACPMDGGAVCAGPDGAIVTAWMRRGSMYQASPGSPETLLGEGVQGWVAHGPDGPHSVWLTSDSAGSGRRTLVVKSPDAARPAVLARKANYPMIAAGPGGAGPVVAVWEDEANRTFAASVVRPADPVEKK